MACGCRDAATCGCRIDETAPITVDGAGTVDAPYTVGVSVSPADNNLLTVEPDGLAVLSDQLTGYCFLDDQGVAVQPDPSTGCYTIPRKTCILDPGGNPLVEDVNGCVTLPEAGTPLYGDGLNADETGTLEVNLSGTWPLHDPTGGTFQGAASGGAPIFIDELGQLRTVPDHTTVTASTNTTAIWTGNAILTPGNSSFSPPIGNISVRNPSASRWMIVVGMMVWNAQMGGPVGGNCYFTPQYDTGSGFVSPGNITQITPPWNVTGATVMASLSGAYSIYFSPIGPGASVNLNVRGAMSNVSSGGNMVRDNSYMRSYLIGITR